MGRLLPGVAVELTVIAAEIDVLVATSTPEKDTPDGPLTERSDVNRLPVIVTFVVVPRGADDGLKAVTAGPATTTRPPTSVALPPLEFTIRTSYDRTTAV
jgi:hypothetical protein